ncbi:FAD-dependent oxidoreductase [Candidatus Woesearchaeota archaeon]|nr:FAD-dependent oxidoreductase [Candidatus Woesearchaeota archaeon]
MEGLIVKPLIGVQSQDQAIEELASKTFDVIIIGGGAAGLGALMYASRYKLESLLVCKEVGGATLEAEKIENYLGFRSISGRELIEKFRMHATAFGGKILENITVETIDRDNGLFLVKTSEGKVLKSKTLIVATGTRRRKLNVPGEEQLAGKGVSYCATCDAPFYKDKVVAIVGGSDAAITGAVQVAEYAKKIYLLVRSKIRAEPVNVDALNVLVNNGKVEVLTGVQVKEIIGSESVEAVKLDNDQVLQVQGVFVEIGGVPNVELVKGLGVSIVNNHIAVDKAMKTNIPGLFAAGDVTDNVLKQDITAVAEGAVSAFSAYQYLKGITGSH